MRIDRNVLLSWKPWISFGIRIGFVPYPAGHANSQSEMFVGCIVRRDIYEFTHQPLVRKINVHVPTLKNLTGLMAPETGDYQFPGVQTIIIAPGA